MHAFIARACDAFDARRQHVRALTAAVLWVMQLGAPETMARVHERDALVRVLVDRAPALLSACRDPHTRRTDHALLRLFAQRGFSLGRAGRFVQQLVDELATWIGPRAARDLVDAAPVLGLLLAEQTAAPSALASIG